MQNCVNGLCEKNKVDKISTSHVSLDELEVRRETRGIEVLQVGTVVKLIKNYNLVVRVVSDETIADMGGDEPSSSCDENVLW